MDIASAWVSAVTSYASARPVPLLPPLTVAPAGLTNYTLKPFQLTGVSWLVDRFERRISCILADEMGLGKTVQSLAYLCALAERGHVTAAASALVIAPLSVVDSWATHAQRFCPSVFNVVSYVGPAADRVALQSKIVDFSKSTRNSTGDSAQHDDATAAAPPKPKPLLVIATYETVSMDAAFFAASLRPAALLVDEAHRLKNPASRLHELLARELRWRHVTLLTGTPVQNRLAELWGLLRFVLPAVFTEDSCQGFVAAFAPLARPLPRSATGGASDAAAAALAACMREARALLAPVLLRRVKAEAGLRLPPRRAVTVSVDLTPLQKQLYRAILARNATQLISAVTATSRAGGVATQRGGGAAASGGGDGISGNSNAALRCFNSVLSSLRRVTAHPYLIPGVEPTPFSEGAHLPAASGKLALLARLLPRLRARGHRVLIFSTSTATLDVIQDCLDASLPQLAYARLDGGVRGFERFAAVDAFQRALMLDSSPNNSNNSTNSSDPQDSSTSACSASAVDGAIDVFLLSTRAGGQGITLTAADTVIFYDSDPNPAADAQAEARCHRLGQTRPVLALRLIARDTFEEVFLRRARRKTALANRVLARLDFGQKHRTDGSGVGGDGTTATIVLDAAAVAGHESRVSAPEFDADEDENESVHCASAGAGDHDNDDDNDDADDKVSNDDLMRAVLYGLDDG